MSEAYIVSAVRTPVGRRNGGLSQLHPVDVAAFTLEQLVKRSGVDPAAIDDVILGNTDSIGPQVGDIARLSLLAAGLPEHVPGVTVDRQCGSSQQAVHFAAQAVMSGTQDMVIAGGIQMMSVVPINMAWMVGQDLLHKIPFSSERWQERYGRVDIDQFRAADLIAEKWEISREEMEQYALASHQRAAHAIANGYFKNEIAPLAGIDTDEGVRADTTLEKMATLKTLREGGRVTAALSSQISDAAAALLICSADALKQYGLEPIARIHTMAVLGDDPEYMLTAPIPATRKALERGGLSANDIDLFEVNEAFASVVMAWQKEIGVERDRVNVNGGAIALGHPIGASGARIMTSLLGEMVRTGKRYGLQTMCEGGGQANVTILEKL